MEEKKELKIDEADTLLSNELQSPSPQVGQYVEDLLETQQIILEVIASVYQKTEMLQVVIENELLEEDTRVT